MNCGDLARLVGCNSCRFYNGDKTSIEMFCYGGCVFEKHAGMLVEVIENDPHDAYYGLSVRLVKTGKKIEGVELIDLAPLSPLEVLALEATDISRSEE